MKKIKARYNGGFWKCCCPKHGTISDVLAEPSSLSMAWCENGEYICPICNPKYYKRVTMLIGGELVKRFDRSGRKTARLIAAEKKEIYQVVFPPDKVEIEKVLSVRNKLDLVTNQFVGKNWETGETIEFLHSENVRLGLEE